jgi:hypothetical protein
MINVDDALLLFCFFEDVLLALVVPRCSEYPHIYGIEQF